MRISDITMPICQHSSHETVNFIKPSECLVLWEKIGDVVFAWSILSCIIVMHSWGKHLDRYQLVAYRSRCAHALFKCICNFVPSSREACVPDWWSFCKEWYLSQLEQQEKLSPCLLASYSSKLRWRILLRFDNDTIAVAKFSLL